jgi:hypothetical protein
MAKRPQGELPFRYEGEPDGDEVTAWAGLPLIIELMHKLGLARHAEAELSIRQREAGFTSFQMLTSMVLLLAAGGECMDDIQMLRHDKALCSLLGHELPSSPSIRRYLELFHDEYVMGARPADPHKAWIAPESRMLRALGRVQTHLVHAIAKNEPAPVRVATIDHDATVIEAHKLLALPHYKGGRGYQPASAIWAETMLALADEFRDGNVPAGMSNLPLIERAFESLPDSVAERYFRADSACYETKVLRWLSEPARKIGFAISADMTPELRELCRKLDEKRWERFETREDLSVDLAEVEFSPGEWPKDAPALRYLVLRFRHLQGELFADGSSTKYFATVTNREGNAAQIIEWHRLKAGTIEQFHAITKNELGAGVMPSGKFGANAAWYRFALLTHNILIALKRLALPPELLDARPKRLRFRVFTLAAKITHHARQLVARIASRLLDAVDLLATRRRVLALAPS